MRFERNCQILFGPSQGSKTRTNILQTKNEKSCVLTMIRQIFFINYFRIFVLLAGLTLLTDSRPGFDCLCGVRVPRDISEYIWQCLPHYSHYPSCDSLYCIVPIRSKIWDWFARYCIIKHDMCLLCCAEYGVKWAIELVWTCLWGNLPRKRGIFFLAELILIY